MGEKVTHKQILDRIKDLEAVMEDIYDFLYEYKREYILWNIGFAILCLILLILNILILSSI